MSETIPQNVLNELKSTNGQVITCKAAVAWEAKKPLDITDIQVIQSQILSIMMQCLKILLFRLSHQKLEKFV